MRTDIQAMRGLAVLAVILFHAKMTTFSSGYLGVDIFFVISGFLITRLVANGVRAQTFSFAEFYFRRAKRLLPAAYTTFFVSALFAPYLLNSTELADFVAQLIGSITFTANIVLWQQSGYFAGASDLKPLLHVWSLAIEEQYYLLLPAFLVFTPSRLWRPLIGVGTCVSLGIFLHRSGSDSTFFLLPTRAWELAIGSVGALVDPKVGATKWLRILFWPALAALLLTPISARVGQSSGANALVACIAALIVILRNHPGWAASRAAQVLSRVGDASYSLYLVHWPIFAFFNNVWMSDGGREAPIWIRCSLIAGSIGLGMLLYRFVERPVHLASTLSRKRVAQLALGSSIVLAILSISLAKFNPPRRDFVSLRRTNFGFDEQCELETDFRSPPACRNDSAPEIMVWGDSYAMHLVPGLARGRSRQKVVQATRSRCGPFLGTTLIGEGEFGTDWAMHCLDFSQSVVDSLPLLPSVRVVVLSSPFTQLVEGDLLVKAGRDSIPRRVAASAGQALESLRRTISAIRSAGKRVVIVGPPPISGFDVGRCLERRERGLPVLGVETSCRIRRSTFESSRRQVIDLLQVASTTLDVAVINLSDYLCSEEFCETRNGSVLIYRDYGHLSHDGSIFLADAMSLAARIDSLAR